MINISPTQLRKAADLQEKIQKLQDELSNILGGEVAPATSTTKAAKPGNRGRKKVSADARARMAEAQRARRAKEKGEMVVEKPAKKRKAKRNVSPALLAALAKAREARAAKRKAAKKAKA
jgi:hypothetical protein